MYQLSMGCASSVDTTEHIRRKSDYELQRSPRSCRSSPLRQDNDNDDADSEAGAELSCTSTTAIRHNDDGRGRGSFSTAPSSRPKVASMLLPAFGQVSAEEGDQNGDEIGATQNDTVSASKGRDGSTSSVNQPQLTIGAATHTNGGAGVSMVSLICTQAPPLFRSLMSSLPDGDQRAAVYRVVKNAVMWDFDTLKDLEWSARGLPRLEWEALSEHTDDAPPFVADRLLTLRLLRQHLDEHHRVKSQQLGGSSKATLEMSMNSRLSIVGYAVTGCPYEDPLETPLRGGASQCQA